MEPATRELIEVGIVASSIVFSAVLIKFLDVYEKWIMGKADLQNSVKQTSTLAELQKARIGNVVERDKVRETGYE